jgi:hypothetical protein
MFQATKADKEDTRKLIHTINNAVSDEPVSEPMLNALFEKLWPDLEAKLETLPTPEQVVDAKRSPNEMLAEILEITRAEASRRRKTDVLDQYIPLLGDVMPILAEVIKTVKVGQLASGADKYAMAAPPLPLAPAEPNR